MSQPERACLTYPQPLIHAVMENKGMLTLRVTSGVTSGVTLEVFVLARDLGSGV